jgi:small subunit ribosomal protein S9
MAPKKKEETEQQPVEETPAAEQAASAEDAPETPAAPEAADEPEAPEATEAAEPETSDAQDAPEPEPVAEAPAEPVAETPAEPVTETPAEQVAEADTPAEGESEPAADAEAPVPAEPEPVRTLVELAADARYSATGKRKSSIARVILLPGSGAFVLNGKPLDGYFPRKTLQEVVRQPLKVTGYLDRVDVRARIHGGGISSQADAVRHGIAKALIEADPSLRGELKRKQLLTRDPRVKERRKAGLKKARKRPQFSKR